MGLCNVRLPVGAKAHAGYAGPVGRIGTSRLPQDDAEIYLAFELLALRCRQSHVAEVSDNRIEA